MGWIFPRSSRRGIEGSVRRFVERAAADRPEAARPAGRGHHGHLWGGARGHRLRRPIDELTYVELRKALGEVLRDDIPQQHEVTRVLEEMSKIARNKLE